MTVQELEQYRPIRGGGVILVAIAVLPPFFYGLTKSVLMSAATPETPRLPVEILSVLSDVLCTLSGIITFMRVDGKVSLGKWIERYWKCNVVGYSVVVHRCEGGRLDLRLGYRHTKLNGMCGICLSDPHFRFVLRLGGWRSAWGRIGGGYGIHTYQVRLHSFGEEGPIMVTLRTGGDQLSLPVDVALQLLAARVPACSTALRSDVQFLLVHDAAAALRREKAFAVIDGAIAQIAGTHRLKCSIEGKNLRKWLEAERGRLLKDDCSGIPEQARATAAITS
ncbi:MAG: hypothetical protein PHI63_01310 [Patescibacteria group bacterium]|nr:hypothetical protein [Patescibacteria group bacterium]